MYYPEPVPQDNDELPAYLDREFRKIASEVQAIAVQNIYFDIVQTLPLRPQEGLVMVFAAGVVTGGSAAGIWEYVGGAWVKL